MSQRTEKVLAVSFVVVLIATAWATTYFAGSDASDDTIDATVEDAPREALDFTLPLLSGPDFNLAEHRGQILIVDFWATWCAPCEVQMPVLNALWKHQREGRGDLMILGISIDTDPAEKVGKWLEERGLEYPIAIGDQDLAMRYGVIGYPTLFVIDPNGVIRLQHVGVLSRPELEEILDEIRQESSAR